MTRAPASVAATVLVAAALVAAVLVAAALVAGCGGGGPGTTGSPGGSGSGTSPGSGSSSHSHAATAPSSAPRPPGVPPGSSLASTLQLRSPAFRDGGTIPKAYTCDGQDVSPPLHWSGVPQGTRELVLVMRDPDAPGGNFVHWALAGIGPSLGAFPTGGVPGLVAPGRNSFGALGFRGPCPPRGSKPHHYVLTLSALSGRSGLRAGFSPDQLRTGALAIATLIGTYARR